MANGSSQDSRGWLVNLAGWLSFAGLLAVGLVGLVRGTSQGDQQLAGAVYLLVSGLAFGTVLTLVLRRGPTG